MSELPERSGKRFGYISEAARLREGRELGREKSDPEHGGIIIAPMTNVVFVAPYFAETTLRFVSAAASLPNVRLGLISQDPAEKLPEDLRRKLAGHYRVEAGLSRAAIEKATRAMKRSFGSVDRLLGTLEQLQVPLGQIREELGITGMGAEAGRNFRDKARMKTVLARHGLPCARHRLVRDPREAFAFGEEVGFPLVAKPPAGAGAQSTFRLDDDRALSECLASMPPSDTRPTLLEEFIVGEEHSFDSVVLGGELTWYSINDYYPAPIEVLRHPWIQWSVVSPIELDHPRYSAIRKVAGPALSVLGLENGLSHMEWFARPDGSVAISEVGARPPGAQFATLLSYAHDFDFYSAWARLMVEDVFDPPPRRYAVGAAYLRGQGTGAHVTAIRGLDEAQRDVGDLVVEVKLPELGQSPSGTYEGEGFVILRHEDTEVVKRGIKRVIEQIYVELA